MAGIFFFAFKHEDIAAPKAQYAVLGYAIEICQIELSTNSRDYRLFSRVLIFFNFDNLIDTPAYQKQIHVYFLLAYNNKKNLFFIRWHSRSKLYSESY